MAFRIDPALRDRLVAAAGDRPLGEEIRRRLEASFAVDRAPAADTKTLALRAALDAAAEAVKWRPAPATPGRGLAAALAQMRARTWHQSATSYAAFKDAIVMLLQIYEPDGEPNEELRRRLADMAFGAASTAAFDREIRAAHPEIFADQAKGEEP
jgi:hypothetical protein